MSPRPEPAAILMAEDDPDDRLFAQKAFEKSGLRNALHVVEDGEALLDYLHRRGRFGDAAGSPRPGIILLDLNMPKKDGRQCLAEIKADPRLRQIPVVVLTTSEAEEDVLRSYDLGASSFITKPVSVDALVAVLRTVGLYWFETVTLPNGRSGG